MKGLFIESTEFTKWVVELLTDEEYAQFQEFLMQNPQAGDVMRGCGGLRKIRWQASSRGKGKRGGVRVIYLYVLEAKWFYLLDIYGKDEKDDLSAAEKKFLAQLAGQLKEEARKAVHRAKEI